MSRIGRGFPIPALTQPFTVPNCALTGTVTATIDESDIVTGGKTIILTLTGETWKAAGTAAIGDIVDTQAWIDGLNGALT